MASVVCQGLQSCLEPRLVEPIILRHKLSPPNPTQQIPPKLTQELDSSDEEFDENNKKKTRDNNGGWSFLEALTNPNHKNNNNAKTDEVYVHPMVKRSASALSTKSLEMCTESLGSETGSDISSDELPPISWEERERLRAIRKRAFVGGKAAGRSCARSFPPPLTSISGLEGVKVIKPQREGGRLVIKAVTIVSSSTCFKAERTNGRLRLSLMKEESPVLSCDEEVIDGEEKVVHENDDELHDDDEMEGYDDDDEEEEGEWDWDMEGNYGKGGGEMGIGELMRRPTRCKEGGNGNRGLTNWGSYWVAIS